MARVIAGMTTSLDGFRCRSSCEPGSWTSCTSTSCRCSWAPACGLFPIDGLEDLTLEPLGVQQVGSRTSLRYRVAR